MERGAGYRSDNNGMVPPIAHSNRHEGCDASGGGGSNGQATYARANFLLSYGRSLGEKGETGNGAPWPARSHLRE
jgi:hypothetical protein